MGAAGESATAIATLLKRKAAGVHQRAHLLEIKLGPFAAGAEAEVELTDLRGGRNIGAGALLTVGLGHSGFASKKAKAK
jgi:hypothetical protein